MQLLKITVQRESQGLKKKRVTTEMNEPDEKQNSVEEVTGLPDSIAQQ